MFAETQSKHLGMSCGKEDELAYRYSYPSSILSQVSRIWPMNIPDFVLTLIPTKVRLLRQKQKILLCVDEE